MKNNDQLAHLKQVGRLLDSKFNGPFGFKFGLDPILGLIPLLGDFITTSLSLYILAQATAFGCSPAVLIRMGTNILVENIIDLVPVVGTVFDFAWKANNKNLMLLEQHLANPRIVTVKSKIILAMICLFLMAFLLSSIYLTVLIAQKMIHWIF